MPNNRIFRKTKNRGKAANHNKIKNIRGIDKCNYEKKNTSPSNRLCLNKTESALWKIKREAHPKHFYLEILQQNLALVARNMCKTSSKVKKIEDLKPILKMSIR